MKVFISAFLLSTAAAITDIQTVDSTVPSSIDVQYNCVFQNQWTRDRHPMNYPLYAAVHWTRQVLASHGSAYNMWKEGSLASSAVKKMAEAGGTAEIIQRLEDNNNSYEVGYSKYMSNDPTMKFNNPLKMTSENRYVSVITKMAPSPDWFSGFHDFNAVNENAQTWYKEFTIQTYPYDAGTEDGNTYDTSNSKTSPQQKVSQFTTNNVPNGIYLNPDGDDILPVAKYTCTLNTYSSSNADIETVDSNISSTQNVQYGCVFENQWNKDRHPLEFPQDALHVHWTKQVLASHDSSYNMWKEGSLASEGVQKLAESGGIANIIEELQDHGDSYDIGYDKYLYAQDPKVIYEPLQMSSNKRYISAITKLSPSPDWFSGFHDFNTVNEKSNTWYEEFIIPIYPFDAGTEDGETYNTVNSRTFPAEQISQFTVDNVPSSKVFLNDKGDDILPVAMYTCTLSILDGGMAPTQSPIFTSLTRSPTGIGGSNTAVETQPTNNYVRLIVSISVGAVATTLIVGVIVYMFCCRKQKQLKEMTEEASTSSSEAEEGNMKVHNIEFA